MVRTAKLHVVNARMKHFAMTLMVTAIMDVRKIGLGPDVTVSSQIDDYSVKALYQNVLAHKKYFHTDEIPISV